MIEQSTLDLFKLNNQIALVVGGNRGLGLELAKALAEAGAHIAIAGRDQERNQDVKATIEATYHVKCLAHACDIAHEEAVKTTVADILDHFGKIDILINSAGINVRGAIEELSVRDFNCVQQVNVTGAWLMCREVVPIMIKSQYGGWIAQ